MLNLLKRHYKHLFIWPLFLFTLWVGLPFSALATELPPGLVRYLKDQDPQVKIRFDGLILFSNGELYIPVLQQAEQGPADPEKVIAKDPAKAAYADIIEFDNHVFLLRLIPTATGKLTLPRRAEYPLSLRQGLLPQDFVLPSQLSIPSDLRVILGSLPYEAPADATPDGTSEQLLQSATNRPVQRPLDPLLLYVADMNRHRLLSIDPNNGKTVWDLDINCVPKTLQLSPTGDRLYASCLTTNEVVVIDTVSNLILTRISLASKPFDAVLLPAFDRLVVSNRAKRSLSRIDTQRQLKLPDVPIAGSPGAMAARQGQSVVFVADTTYPKIFEVEITSGQLLRTLNEKGKIPLITGIQDLYLQESSTNLGRLWLLNRQQGKLQAIDLFTQQIVYEQTIGGKPTQMIGGPGNRLYVLCAQTDLIEQFDMEGLTRLEPMQLPAGSFPTGIGVDASGRYAYVTAAADEQLFVVDLKNNQVTNTYPYQARAIDVALYDQRGVDEQLAAIDEVRARKAKALSIQVNPITTTKTRKSGPPGVVTKETVAPEPSVTSTDPMTRPAGPVRRPGWWPFGRRGQP